MSTLPSKSVPSSYKRVVLVNPTKYLGNLLLSGGLIQQYLRWCEQNDIALLIVLDESFRNLLGDSLQPEKLLFYPRQRIKAGRVWTRLRLFLSCVRAIRAFRPDLAFNIEEDPVTDRLTRYSGAGFKLGCSKTRHNRGYSRVEPLDFASGHRWDAYRQMFTAVGMPDNRRRYMRLQIPAPDQDYLDTLGIGDKPYVVMHAGATKDYKRWPAERFAVLARLLINKGNQVVLIGAGKSDAAINDSITANLAKRGLGDGCTDLCNRLSLRELAQVQLGAHAMVGNDSGPFHLAASLRVPGVVIFGPTDLTLWAPISGKCVVIRGSGHCDPACSRGNCVRNHACLNAIAPQFVEQQIVKITSK